MDGQISMPLEDKEYWKSLINMGLSKFLILRTLKQGPAHGYIILKKLTEFTKGCCMPTYGAIYPILKELLDGEYVRAKTEIVESRRRIVYELTAKGENAYSVAYAAWKEVVPFLNMIIEDK
ncbi:MAG: PadR family transcriptional regulator [Candidatus Verstraetearchaeota archaeon]|nr:PadR family transcriptional regulator [Candidatus Verstraetearchaeota archaeon]